MKQRSALTLAMLAVLAPPVAAQTIAITGGKLVVGDGTPPIDGGTVVISNGKVVAAGKGVAIPAGAQRIDADGKWVTPGLVAGFTRLGLAGNDAVDGANDTAANNSPFNASIDIAPAVNSDWAAIPVSRAAGVTRAIVAPNAANGAIFGGQGAVIDTGADMQPVTKSRAFQFVEFGEGGARRAGGSRPAWFAAFRNALDEARDAAAGRPREDGAMRRADTLALAPVLTGQMRLFVHVESAPDILALLALKREVPALDLVLIGATEGWRVAPQIAAAKVPVIASALNNLPDSFQQLAATHSNVGRMKAAGVLVALGMIDQDETRQAQLSTQHAGNLVAIAKLPGHKGLSWDEAFAAIASRPAEIVGMGGLIGVLKPGAAGDAVIWDGDPLELSTGVAAVWIDGVRQPLKTRQTELRDRYAASTEGALPKAYERDGWKPGPQPVMEAQ